MTYVKETVVNFDPETITAVNSAWRNIQKKGYPTGAGTLAALVEEAATAAGQFRATVLYQLAAQALACAEALDTEIARKMHPASLR